MESKCDNRDYVVVEREGCQLPGNNYDAAAKSGAAFRTWNRKEHPSRYFCPVAGKTIDPVIMIVSIELWWLLNTDLDTGLQLSGLIELARLYLIY